MQGPAGEKRIMSCKSDDVMSLFIAVYRHFELPDDAKPSPQSLFCRRDAAFDGAQAGKSAESL